MATKKAAGTVTLTPEELQAIIEKAVAAARGVQPEDNDDDEVKGEAGDFTAEDVRAQDWEFFSNLKDEMYRRQPDGKPLTKLSKRGNDMVVLKKGIAYWQYRLVKGIAKQLMPSAKNPEPKALTKKQVNVLVNILNLPAIAGLFTVQEQEQPKPKSKAKAAAK